MTVSSSLSQGVQRAGLHAAPPGCMPGLVGWSVKCLLTQRNVPETGCKWDDYVVDKASLKRRLQNKYILMCMCVYLLWVPTAFFCHFTS